jgi:hypothetical protein
VLEEAQLTFLLPLLHIRAEIWRQLETHPSPEAFLAWLTEAVPAPHLADPAFVLALVQNILRYVTERTGDGGGEAVEKEKELILSFKPVLQAFIKNSPALQLTAVYAMQVQKETLIMHKTNMLSVESLMHCSESVLRDPAYFHSKFRILQKMNGQTF